jgi:hypothetical protein
LITRSQACVVPPNSTLHLFHFFLVRLRKSRAEHTRLDSTRSGRGRQQLLGRPGLFVRADTPPTSRRFTPTPIETTTKKVRKFAVEPVETTRSSNKKDAAPKEDEVDRKDFQQPTPGVTTKRRFAPEPVETTFKSSKQVKELPTPERTPDKTEDVSVEIPRVQLVPDTPTPRRRFVPELIETTKRSKKAGDLRPATLPTDKVPLHSFYTLHRLTITD